jgi:hypothetical protein
LLQVKIPFSSFSKPNFHHIKEIVRPRNNTNFPSEWKEFFFAKSGVIPCPHFVKKKAFA